MCRKDYIFFGVIFLWLIVILFEVIMIPNFATKYGTFLNVIPITLLFIIIMPTFNFIKKKDDVIKTTDKKPDDSIGKIDTNTIKLYFDVISSKKVDREKTYYSAFFKSLFLFTNFNAKSYNILQKYNNEEKRYTTISIVWIRRCCPSFL